MTKPLPEVIAESNSRLSLQEQVRVLREALDALLKDQALYRDYGMNPDLSSSEFDRRARLIAHARYTLTSTADREG